MPTASAPRNIFFIFFIFFISYINIYKKDKKSTIFDKKNILIILNNVLSFILRMRKTPHKYMHLNNENTPLENFDREKNKLFDFPFLNKKEWLDIPVL